MASSNKFETESKKTQTNYSAATKSQNELYYQMASILKEISDDGGAMAQKIFSRKLPEQAEIFVEKK